MITLSGRTAAAVATGLTTLTAAVTAGALAMGPIASERPGLGDAEGVPAASTMLEPSDAAIADFRSESLAAETTALASSAGYLGNEATTFVPVAPCRVADTRSSSAGRIASGTVRNFVVTDADTSKFKGQGGVSTGCGIPENAVAVQAALKAVAPNGNGYMRAWAYGTAEPPSTALTFTTGTDIGDATVLPIGGPGTPYQLKARPYKGSLHLLIDVTGYYVLNDQGLITPDAFYAAGGATLWGLEKPDTGFYTILVDHDLQFCSYQVTPWDSDLVASATMSAEWNNEFYVYLQDRETGAPKDGAFYYSVTC